MGHRSVFFWLPAVAAIVACESSDPSPSGAGATGEAGASSSNTGGTGGANSNSTGGLGGATSSGMGGAASSGMGGIGGTGGATSSGMGGIGGAGGATSSGMGGIGGIGGATSSGMGGTGGLGGASSGTGGEGTGGEGTGGVGTGGTGGSGGGGGCTEGTTGCDCAPANTCEAGSTCIDGTCEAGCCSGFTDTGTCTFDGGPQDPGFMTNNTWTAVDGAAVDGTTGIDAGRAFFSSNSLCNLGPEVTQSFPSPELSCAPPLLMSYHTQITCTGSCLERPRLQIGINGGWNEIDPALGAWQTGQICLGTRPLGGTADLVLGARRRPGFCPFYPGTLAVDGVSFAVDTTGVCPAPGTVPNADFEGGAASWTLAPQNGTAEIKAGAGNGPSSAAHLAMTQLCQYPSVTGTVNIPTAQMVPNPALKVWSNGTTASLASVKIGLSGITQLPGQGTSKVQNICLPQWALGTVQPLSLGLVNTVGAGSCGTATPRDFAFDDFAIVSEPGCTAGANILDPGFEQVTQASNAAPFWNLEQYSNWPDTTVQLKQDPANAHSGNVAALLESKSQCFDYLTLSGSVTVPSPDVAAGATLKFWYKTSAALTHVKFSVYLDSLPLQLALPVSTTWKQVVLCLDPKLASRPDTLRFSMSQAVGGTCGVTFQAEQLWIDDVELTTDPTCPAI